MTPDTFETLLAPNLQLVRRLVQIKLRIPQQTDDIVQQTLLRAYARRDQLRAPAKFKSWICQIAVNEIKMYLRGRRPYISLDEFHPQELAKRSPCSPLDTFLKKEREHCLRVGFAKLKARDRAAIRLIDFRQLSVKEAAGELSLSRVAVKSAHFRARQRLKQAVCNVVHEGKAVETAA